MLPFIVGTIALAATGYGVRKYLEEDANEQTNFYDLKNKYKEHFYSNAQDDSYMSSTNDKNLLNRSLRELQTALNEIKNLDINIASPIFLDKDAKEPSKNYMSILMDAQSYIETNLDKLDTIIISSNDYTTYSDEDKNFVKEQVELLCNIEKATKLEMSFEDEDISREIKRAFAKIQRVIN